MKLPKKVMLVILDGFGIGKKDQSDAIYNAKTPFTDSLTTNYPNSTLLTHEHNVGLPKGQMGNSEVGHLNIGAGRVVWQQLVRINRSFENKEIDTNLTLLKAIDYANSNNKNIHLLGLTSNGGIHSSMKHLKGLTQLLSEKAKVNTYIHAFTDGRDTDPKSGKQFIDEILEFTKNTSISLATVIGRYFAMDRDKRWDRVAKAYHLLVEGKGEKSVQILDTIQRKYDEGETDEFLEPIICNEKGVIKKDDVVIFFNFRTDRGRELTVMLTQHNFPEQNTKTIPLYYITLTEYNKDFKNIKILFPNIDLKNTLGEVIADNNLKQLRSAETEKYPHVSFFFSGGIEKEFKGESRYMEQSPKVATYDLQPGMSALPLTNKVIELTEQNQYDFVCLNFANCDMVGHTGVWEAITKAAETVDTQLKRLVDFGLKNDYSFLITADHGNADFAVNNDGSPNTAHSTNPVPIWLVSNSYKNEISNGILADLAPTVLEIMNIKQPKEMTGKSLLK